MTSLQTVLILRARTDGALAMGLLNMIIKEGLYDADFVEKWTNAPYLIRSNSGKFLRESDLIDEVRVCATAFRAVS
jgi:anaerobic selenocysteine-containing dehydrogenase